MSVSSYLTRLTDYAIVRDSGKAALQRSIGNLETKLKAHFGAQLRSGFVFGSYSRGTILPRSMDDQSDVDYMVVFSDGDLRPQAYLDRLRRFAEIHYARSEVAQSHPTVALELNHIRIELVPATQDWFGTLRIPVKGSGYGSWQDTDPKAFNERLTRANQQNGNFIKPLVRALKYWNALAGYPFESYALEQHLAGEVYGHFGLIAFRQLGQYFYQGAESLDAGWFAPQWKQDAVSRLKQRVALAKSQESSGDVAAAEMTIQRLLPPVGGLVGR